MSPAASTRWCPTPEQVMILEEMYKAGVRTPNATQIQQITAHLSLYGKIEGKNVFYWFQNHKARDRQKLRKRLLSPKPLLPHPHPHPHPHHQPSPNNPLTMFHHHHHHHHRHHVIPSIFDHPNFQPPPLLRRLHVPPPPPPPLPPPPPPCYPLPSLAFHCQLPRTSSTPTFAAPQVGTEIEGMCGVRTQQKGTWTSRERSDGYYVARVKPSLRHSITNYYGPDQHHDDDDDDEDNDDDEEEENDDGDVITKRPLKTLQLFPVN